MGRVGIHVYSRYLAAWSPTYLLPVGMLASGVVERTLQAGHRHGAVLTCVYAVLELVRHTAPKSKKSP